MTIALDPAATFTLCDLRLSPRVSGALWWEAERTLIVSDLHLEKGSAYAARGAMLPPYDSRATLARLAAEMAALRPARVIALGDTFHDGQGWQRLPAEDKARLAGLAAAAAWVWIAGNHDPQPPAALGGVVTDAFVCGGLVFRHEPQAGPQHGEVAGHLHPVANVASRGRSFRRRCFATDGERLVMPAFGAYAGGLCVRDAAFAPLFPRPFRAWVLGATRVVPVASQRLFAGR